MLYLAEVQKRPTGFGLGGGKTDLKLLACQRGEHNWLAVPGEEVIPADEAKEFSSGALVLVDLNNNKQVLQIQDAGRQLVKILQKKELRCHNRLKQTKFAEAPAPRTPALSAPITVH